MITPAVSVCLLALFSWFLLNVVSSVLGSNLHVVNGVVLVVGLALQVTDSGINSGLGLAHIVVQNGAGHAAGGNSLHSLFQSVNTHQIDVLANLAAGSLDGLQGAHSHSVVVAEDHVNFVVELAQNVGSILLALGLIPVSALLVQLVDLQAGILQSLDGVLGAVLSIHVLGVAHCR